MKMHTDSLDGFAIAPGITFSYLAKSFSVNLNAQYFWVTGELTGKGGNVDLPKLELKNNSILEVALGVNIPFTDRLTGYIQGLYYGIDRNGGGGQLGVSWKF